MLRSLALLGAALFAYCGLKLSAPGRVEDCPPGLGCCGRPDTCVCRLHAQMEFRFGVDIPRVNKFNNKVVD